MSAAYEIVANALKVADGTRGVDHKQDLLGMAPFYQAGHTGVHVKSLVQVSVHLWYAYRFRKKGRHLLHGIREGDAVGGVAFEYLFQGRFQSRKGKPNKVKGPAGSQTLVPVGGNNGSAPIIHI